MKNLRLLALAAMMSLCAGLSAQTKVIAHRGYWTAEGSAQNSIAALKDAHKIGVYGSEFDVHITKDGVVVVNHDDDINKVKIEDANYAQIKDMKLKNGETLPTLEQYLAEGKKLAGTQMILEIKAHATPEKEDRCIAATIDLVRKFNMEKQVEYISFSLHACEQIVKANPKAVVYYLMGDLNPDEIKAKGFAGMDYYGVIFMHHPDWIEKCRKLGLKTNVWTIDNLDEIKKFADMKVDFITTNKPVEALKIVSGK